MARSAFLDETVIEVQGGKGGNGSASLHRTKRQPRGGPDGGNGGDGGDVFAKADIGVNSLYDFVSKRSYRAEAGKDGGSKKCHGSNGKDVELRMPVGTEVHDEATGALHASLLDGGQRVLLVHGGHGGRGNVTFKSSTNRTPRERTLGGDGDCQTFRLTLRLLADVGLIGLPNAGKTTFLNTVADANAQIGDYPFTTLKPHLGVVELEDYSQLTFADMPGLIAGAAQGIGLGTRFLRHVSRTTALLHFVDASSGSVEEIRAQHDLLVAEIVDADLSELLDKPRVLVLSKADLLSAANADALVEETAKTVDVSLVHALSSHARTGVDELVMISAGLVRQGEKVNVT